MNPLFCKSKLDPSLIILALFWALLVCFRSRVTGRWPKRWGGHKPRFKLEAAQRLSIL